MATSRSKPIKAPLARMGVFQVGPRMFLALADVLLRIENVEEQMATVSVQTTTTSAGRKIDYVIMRAKPQKKGKRSRAISLGTLDSIPGLIFRLVELVNRRQREQGLMELDVALPQLGERGRGNVGQGEPRHAVDGPEGIEPMPAHGQDPGPVAPSASTRDCAPSPAPEVATVVFSGSLPANSSIETDHARIEPVAPICAGQGKPLAGPPPCPEGAGQCPGLSPDPASATGLPEGGTANAGNAPSS